MALRLQFQTPDGEDRAVDLGGIDSIVLGRDRDIARLVIPDPQVSRGHCRIGWDDDELFIEDMGSRNGTWVNNTRVTQATLRSGDVIRIGATEIRVKATGSGAFANSLLGKSINGFEFQEMLGQGSYGTVYRGLQVALGRPVAIKVLDKRHQEDPARVQAFLEEARRAGRLNHPNVVQVHDVCQADGHLFLVMELVAGGSMSDNLRINGPIDAEQACQTLSDIGLALGYAEAQHLVHRDVKPDNILVNDDGVYKLADLGIAAPISDDGRAHQVRAFGSAHYVAPEQARGGTIDGRADIYGLGAALFHLLAGRPMYEGTSREIVAAHINRPPPDLGHLRPDLPKALVQLIHQMLEKDPEHRPRSGKDLAQRAEALLLQLERVGAGAAGATGASGKRRRVRRRRRRRRR